MATLEEERRKLQILQRAILGFTWVMLIGRELVYCFLKKTNFQESILAGLVMIAIATALVQYAFRAVAKWYPTELRRFQESLVLLDIATAVSSTLDLTQMLKLIAQRTAEACQVHRCSILLFDEQRQRIRPLMSQYASGAIDKESWERFRYRTYAQSVEEVPVLKRVIEDRQPLVLDAATISSLPEAWTEPFKICSLLIVPLVARDCIIGIMALDHVEPAKHFTQEQINLAMAIGSQVAVALENARLYQLVREEKAKTEIVLQETFSGIITVDDHLRILSLNSGAEAIIGYSASQVVGKRLVEVFGKDIVAPGSPLARALESGEKVPPVETALSGRQGVRDVLLGVTPLPRVGQSSAHYLLSFADITGLKEVDRLKSSIVANVSHELRAPLSSIKAYTELLLSHVEGDGEAQRREWLSVIDRETDRLTALINDFLNLSRLESGHFELTKNSLQLGEVIADIVASLQVQAQQRDITIELDVQPDLPGLEADDNLIRIAIRNLVSNAIKFSYDGGHIRIRVWEEGKDVKFYVQDEGIGIAQEAIPYLFTKFFRVPSAAAADAQGTGLGLALAKEAVLAHAGRVEVESTPGKGSRFTVTIPRACEAVGDTPLHMPETDEEFSRHK